MTRVYLTLALCLFTVQKRVQMSILLLPIWYQMICFRNCNDEDSVEIPLQLSLIIIHDRYWWYRACIVPRDIINVSFRWNCMRTSYHWHQFIILFWRFIPHFSNITELQHLERQTRQTFSGRNEITEMVWVVENHIWFKWVNFYLHFKFTYFHHKSLYNPSFRSEITRSNGLYSSNCLAIFTSNK